MRFLHYKPADNRSAGFYIIDNHITLYSKSQFIDRSIEKTRRECIYAFRNKITPRWGDFVPNPSEIEIFMPIEVTNICGTDLSVPYNGCPINWTVFGKEEYP